MMEKNYKTRIKNNHPVFGENQYVTGVVMGMLTMIAGEDHIGLTLFDRKTGDHVFQSRTTEEKYNYFVSRVNEKYPGLCEFDTIVE